MNQKMAEKKKLFPADINEQPPPLEFELGAGGGGGGGVGSVA